MIKKLLIDLLTINNANVDEIGILTPYKKQEECIKKMI